MTDMIIDSLQASTDSIPHVVAEVVSDSTLHNISSMMETTANNTAFGWLPEGVDLTIAAVALLFSFVTWLAQWRTEHNTSRLSKGEQRNLLIGMIRHLYRNLVIVYTIAVKMKASGYKSYPSEEHLKKLKVNLGELHLNLFFKDDEQYREMNQLYVEMRNYNYEIDVICTHLKDPQIDTDTKQRDLNTLRFKSAYLTERIVKVITLIWETVPGGFGKKCAYYLSKLKVWKKSYTPIMEEAVAVIDKVQKEKQNPQSDTPFQSGDFEPYADYEGFYLKRLYEGHPDEFINPFHQDVKNECGKNPSGGEKVHMIKLLSGEA